jgi:PAS domain S-box-containing protein
VARDLISSSRQRSHRAAGHMKRFATVLLFLSLALLGSLLLHNAAPRAYLFLLTGACGVSGWFVGRNYGVVSGVLASLLASHFFFLPLRSWSVEANELPSIGLLCAAGICAGWLSGEWRNNRDQLKENKEQFRLLLDGVKDHAVFLLDAEGNVATWNTGSQRTTGYAAADILGNPHSIFFSQEESGRGRPEELLHTAARQGSVHINGARIRKDGTQFWAEVAITALYREDGSLRGYTETIRDISELRAKQEALEAKEQELRCVVEYAPDAVLMVNESGVILFANAETASMFGYSLKELLGKKIEMLVPAARRAAHVAHRGDFQKEPHRRPMGTGLELFAVKKNGTEFPVEIGLGPVEFSMERRFVACVRDITERRLMEQELQDRNIQELAQLMVRDIDGRIMHWNAGMNRLYGYSRIEAEGAISHHLLRTSFPAQLESIEAELLRTGFWEGELIHHKKDGEPIHVNSYWVLHRDKNGKPYRVLESSIDVTALKRAEENARQLNRKLERQNADLSIAKRLIETQTQKIATTAKMSALGEMAGGMAHEINNPMGIIHARASDLMEAAQAMESVPAKMVIDAMEKIRSTATRVSKITLGLRKFARETHSDPAVNVPLREIVDDTLSFCTQRLKQYSIDLRVQPIAPALRISCKPTEISQVLLNLLNNAVDAVQNLPEKWVELSARECGDNLEISVTDSGSGIPESIREKMGQPFFTTKEVGLGTGLGLSISRGIIEAHGGQLSLDSDCAHTRFVIKLPKCVAVRKEAVLAGR